VLPDGCLDLIWDGGRLFVAGPDSTARRHLSAAGTSYAALRFAGGTGPQLLGIPAHHLLDQTPDLAEMWNPHAVRRLTARVAPDPGRALNDWLIERAAQRPLDPWGSRVLALTRAGLPVAAIAERIGISPRQLHRRCLPVFGYGPARLARITRLGAAITRMRAGAALAEVAAQCGYADQAHLCREVRALVGTTPTALR
jgi:AraC-like DNA-binding protein